MIQYDPSEFIPPWFLGNEGIEAYLRADNYVVLDYETNNLQKGSPTNKDNHLVLACWTVVKNGREVKKYKFGDEYEMQELVDDVMAADFTIAYNAQFELGWLARCGLDLHDVLVYDPMIMEWVLQGNITVPLNLEATATRYKMDGKESLVSKLIKMQVDPANIPRSWLLKYCIQDVALTHELFKKQSKKLSDADLWHIALSRNLVIPVLADMQAQGLELDKEKVYAAEAEQRAIIEDLGVQLDEITGGINLGSPKQLSIFLYNTIGFAKIKDREGNEISSTAQDIVAQLESSTDEQRKFLELYKAYNTASTLLSKTLNYLKNVCDHMDGRFYGAIVQGRTKTHRLAGSGIKIKFPKAKLESSFQLQNIPRQYKHVFTAHDPDYEVMEFDGAGMEFRSAVILGRDKQGEEDIVGGADVHAFTRDTMNAAYIKFGIDKQIDRQGAKSSTFTPLFWGQGKDEAEQEYAKAFAEKYFGIREEQQRWVNIVADKKKLTTPYGMIYYWPHAKMYRSGYVSGSTEIVNIPIQGFATAECIPISLVHFWHRVRGMPIHLFNTVHDSGVTRQRKDYRDVAIQAAKVAMTTDVYGFLKSVYNYDTGSCPLGVGFKIGTHWGVSDKEIIYDVWQDGNERMTIDEKKVKTVVYDTREKNVILD